MSSLATACSLRCVRKAISLVGVKREDHNGTMEGVKETEREESWISFITKLRTKPAKERHTDNKKHKKSHTIGRQGPTQDN